MEATLLSFEGDKIGATERIYKVGNDKEEKYRKSGIKKVEEHLQKFGSVWLFSIIFHILNKLSK